MDTDTIAIIAGCVAGGVVLVIVMAATIYVLCGRRKHRKKRKHSTKFRPPVSPGHSQPSSLGHNPEARLPKVNSTGLWMGAPSMYTGGPAPAYYIGRNVPVAAKYPADPRLVPRASSETRIPQAGYPYVQPRAFYGSQGDLLMMPSQGGPRIYHSQQLTPVFEVPVRNGGMEIYDVYQFGDVSKSKLVEARHTPSFFEDGFRLGPRLERSKSDLGDKARPARRTSEKSRQPSHHSRSSSNEGNKRHRSSSRDKDNRQNFELGKGSRGSRSADSFKAGVSVSRDASHSQRSNSSGQNNRAFSADADVGRVSSIKEEVIVKPSTIPADAKPPLPTSPATTNSHDDVNNKIINPSATDSMKLLAKNKTDDQKTIVPKTGNIIMGHDLERNTADGKNVGHEHSVYQGDIYAVSNNRKSPEVEENDNPIISRMKDMVIEKSRNDNSPSARESRTSYDIQTTNSDFSNSHRGSTYEEIKIEKMKRITQEITMTPDMENGERIHDVERPKITQLANLADLSILDGIELPPASDISHYSALDASSGSRDAGIANNSHGEETSTLATSPVAMRVRKTSVRNADEVDGKRITDSAFEFLNTYLSDDEGTDIQVDSPPLSPTS